MSSGFAIQAEGLGKRYRLGTSKRRHDSIRDALADRLAAPFRGGKGRIGPDHFWALRDASFEIAHGENVGFIGLNGAGKSTSLKILSRITEPTTGKVRINGRLGALLEVGTGFHGDLTGRENVYLYGSILGMRRTEVRRKFDAIVEFSEIGGFIDTPVKRYSSGMYVRLAFAVAAHLEPDILLLDEVLAVGDLPFQRKCIEFAKGLQRRDATILFVSHNMFSIKSMCSRVIYLRKGEITYDGPTEGGIALYEEDCQLTAPHWSKVPPETAPISVTSVSLLAEDGEPRTVFGFGERMKLKLSYDARERVSQPNFIVAFLRSDGVACCNFSSEADVFQTGSLTGPGEIELKTPPLKLTADTYSISILIREPGFQQLICAQNGPTFHVKHDLYDAHFGVFHETGQWIAR